MFDESQEVVDVMAEEDVQKEYRPVDIWNLFDDDDNDSLPSNVDNNDRSGILDREDFIEEEKTPSFRKDYARGIEPVLETVDMLFSRSMWNGSPIITHAPASTT